MSDLSGLPNVVYETMTRVQFGDYTIRVWRNCGSMFRMGPDREILSMFRQMAKEYFGDRPEREEIVDRLRNMMDVEAFEILDGEGNGGLMYPDWK